MTHVAMLSMHTSPLDQPGVGDGGGMNVYVHELASALAQAGVRTTVYSRASATRLPGRKQIEPLYEVVHVAAGRRDLTKDELVDVIDEFADAVGADLARSGATDVVLHANYWLSGAAAHILKHRLGVPLVTTFHTLARVKSARGDTESAHRERVEAEIIGCSDLMCASNQAEVEDLVGWYGADRRRIEIIPPGVHHAFFSPGDRGAARSAVRIHDVTTLLFVGRIQPLKGLDLAVESLALLHDTDTQLVVVGGPSGAEGAHEYSRIRRRVDQLGLNARVHFVPPQPHHLLSTYYRAADITLVPSRSESFGLVALESMACGTPVVAARVGGLAELVGDRGGVLVDGRDPHMWASVIDSLAHDLALRTRLSASAAQRGREFSWSAAAGRLRRLAGDLATEREPVLCARGN